MCRFMLIFDILKHGSSTSNFNSYDNIARIIKSDISKSKLALSTFLIVFMLYEIIYSYYIFNGLHKGLHKQFIIPTALKNINKSFNK